MDQTEQLKRLEERVRQLEQTINGDHTGNGLVRRVGVLWVTVFGGVDWQKIGIAEQVRELVDVRRGARWNMLAIAATLVTILGSIVGLALILSQVATTGGGR